CQGKTDCGDTESPAITIENLSDYRCSGQPSAIVGGEIETARRGPIGFCGAPDIAGPDGLGKEGSDTHKHHPCQHASEARQDQKWQPGKGDQQAAPQCRTGPKEKSKTPGKRGCDHRREKDEVNQAQRHSIDRDGRANQDEVHIGENADKGEQDEKANAEGCSKGWIAQMLAPACQRRRSLACSAERRYSAQIEDDQESSSQIQDGEEVEACRKAEQIGDRGSNEAPNQIAGDNASDIGGQRRRR